MKSPKRTKSLISKRSVAISGLRTSISLEDQFWEALREIATERGSTLTGLITSIDREREGNLSSAIRVYVLDHFRDQIAARTPTA